MAKVVAYKNPKVFEYNWDDKAARVRCEKVMEEIEATSKAVNLSRSLVGLLVKFPVADGYSFYRVVKDTPLTLEHIPYGDAWHTHPALLRGLTKTGIIKSERATRKFIAALNYRA